MVPGVLSAITFDLVVGAAKSATSSGSDWQETAKTVTSIITAVGILVGGVWAYWLYVRQRTRWPRAEVELELTHRQLLGDLNLLSVKVKIHNAGRGLMQPSTTRVDVNRVLPLLPETEARLVAERELYDGEGFEAEWPCVAYQERPWRQGQFDIEPGENGECVFDFFIDAEIETVSVYIYVDNRAKRGWICHDELGWNLTAIYDLVEPAGTARADNLVRRETAIEEREKYPNPPSPSPGEGGLEEAQREPRPKPVVQSPAEQSEPDEQNGGGAAGDGDAEE